MVLSVGAVIGLLLAVLVCFVALAILCDDYLCPALEFVCAKFKLPDHVAAASLLAMGSAAPELAMNALATAHVGQDEVRLSVPAIFGSAVIAFGLIPAVCCLAATHKGATHIRLTAWPVTRDCFMYILCLGANIWVLEDGAVDALESLMLCALFGVYMLVVYKLPQGVGCPTIAAAGSGGPAVDTVRKDAATGLLDAAPAANPLATSSYGSMNAESQAQTIPRSGVGSVEAEAEAVASSQGDAPGALTRLRWLCSVVVWRPLEWVFAHTIPAIETDDDGEVDAERQSTAKALLTFVISVVYLAVLSDVVLEITKVVSDSLGIERAVAGATVLALGAQVPDTIASMALARAGMYDGAVSNAIGSQVINVTLGTGLPFLCFTLSQHMPIVTFPAGMVFLSFVLFGVVAVYVAVLFAPTLCAASNGGDGYASGGTGIYLYRGGAKTLLAAYALANVVIIALTGRYVQSRS